MPHLHLAYEGLEMVGLNGSVDGGTTLEAGVTCGGRLASLKAYILKHEAFLHSHAGTVRN